MIRPLVAIAVVKKKNPKLSVLSIYSKKDKKEIWVGDDEQMVDVVITIKK